MAIAIQLPPQPPEGPVDWLRLVQDLMQRNSQPIASSEMVDGILTLRTANTPRFIPAIVKLRLTDREILVLWEYSDARRTGWRQRVLGGYGEDFNRFILSFSGNHCRKVRRMTPEDWTREVFSTTYSGVVLGPRERDHPRCLSGSPNEPPDQDWIHSGGTPAWGFPGTICRAAIQRRQTFPNCQ